MTILAASSSSTTGTLVAPVSGNVNLSSLKNNFIHQINIAELTVQTVEYSQPFINITKNFQMWSEISVRDLKIIGYSLGFTDVDNWKSKVYNDSTSATVTTKSGDGMTNYRLFIHVATIGGVADNIYSTANQFDRIYKAGIQKRLGWYTDSTAGHVNGMFGTSTETVLNPN